jgi:hypothetical protein
MLWGRPHVGRRKRLIIPHFTRVLRPPAPDRPVSPALLAYGVTVYTNVCYQTLLAFTLDLLLLN